MDDIKKERSYKREAAFTTSPFFMRAIEVSSKLTFYPETLTILDDEMRCNSNDLEREKYHNGIQWQIG